MSDQLPHKQKLYCYVDESGQDTGGAVFLAVVVILGSARDALRAYLGELEERSGKGIRKWTRATPGQRLAYVRGVIGHEGLAGVYFSLYQNSLEYVDLTILSVAKAVNKHTQRPYSAAVYVDGLQRTEEHRFARGLRDLRIKARKVRGLKDESDVFIRLADAIAGFVRDGLTHEDAFWLLYEEALRLQKIRQV